MGKELPTMCLPLPVAGFPTTDNAKCIEPQNKTFNSLPLFIFLEMIIIG